MNKLNTPSFKAVFGDTAYGWKNPNDSVLVLDNGEQAVTETALDDTVFKSTLTQTPGAHQITLTTSKGYTTSDSIYYTEIKNNTALPFNPFNGDTTSINYELTAQDKVYIGIVKGSLSQLQSVQLPENFDPNNPPAELTNLVTPIKALLVGEDQQPGTYQINWDGKDESGNIVNEGVYTYSIFGFTEGKKYASMPIAVGEVEVFKGVVLNSVTASVSGFNTATISWNTDLEASSKIEYAECPLASSSCQVLSSSDVTLTKNHTLLLTNLKQGVSYYYKVISTGVDGKTSVSREYNFELPKVIGMNDSKGYKIFSQFALLPVKPNTKSESEFVNSSATNTTCKSDFITNSPSIGCCGHEPCRGSKTGCPPCGCGCGGPGNKMFSGAKISLFDPGLPPPECCEGKTSSCKNCGIRVKTKITLSEDELKCAFPTPPSSCPMFCWLVGWEEIIIFNSCNDTELLRFGFPYYQRLWSTIYCTGPFFPPTL